MNFRSMKKVRKLLCILVLALSGCIGPDTKGTWRVHCNRCGQTTGVTCKAKDLSWESGDCIHCGADLIGPGDEIGYQPLADKVWVAPK